MLWCVRLISAQVEWHGSSRCRYRLTRGAQRQGKLVAQNVAAFLGKGIPQPYKHRDLGFLVDLGGLAAAANPLNIPLSGPAASADTRGYHLYSMSGNRMRVLTDWTDNAVTRTEVASLHVISVKSVPPDVDHPRA